MYDSDHLGSGDGSIKQKLKKWLIKFGHKEEYSTVKMITTLRVFKHTFNPVIFYYCLDSENNIVYHVSSVVFQGQSSVVAFLRPSLGVVVDGSCVGGSGYGSSR